MVYKEIMIMIIKGDNKEKILVHEATGHIKHSSNFLNDCTYI
jgi:hypothetical protein